VTFLKASQADRILHCDDGVRHEIRNASAIQYRSGQLCSFKAFKGYEREPQRHPALKHEHPVLFVSADPNYLDRAPRMARNCIRDAS
jgi:hypothetical protein